MPISLQSLLIVVTAAAFLLFLLWKYRPAFGRAVRRPADGDVRAARERARLANSPREKSEAFVLAAQAAAGGPDGLTAALGYYVRAMRADPTASEPVLGLCDLLGRKRPELLESVLWHRLSILGWSGDTAGAARCAAQSLAQLYARRLKHRDRAAVIERLADRIG
jgi:hypothetical protein